MSLLKVSGLAVSYADAGLEVPVVEDLAFTVEAGEAIGLVGESGSGKTQTALAIMGLLPAAAIASGSIRFGGVELQGQKPALLNRYRARRLAMIFQDPKLALNPYLSVGQQLRRVLLEHRIAGGQEAKPLAIDWLRRVRLAPRQYDAYPHQLSGGMRQRAMIALALCCEPKVLIADEPTTALDVTVQAEILSLLQELRADTGIALLLITHDLGVIAENCERLLVMHRGRLLEQGTTRAVFDAPAHEMTRKMIGAARFESPPPPAAPAADDAPLLRVDRISVTFDRRRDGESAAHGAVSDVSFSLGVGETLAVVGESGSGKTTLARVIAGLEPPDSGRVYLCGALLPARAQARDMHIRRTLQMVFQDPVASLNPAHRVAAILGEAAALFRPAVAGRERKTLVAEALARVRLGEALLQRFPHELSGGQAQRVAIARALLAEPKILVCDEALAALDGTVRRSILDLLQAEQQRSSLSMIFISHDLAVVRQISHRVMVMNDGRVCETAGNEELFARPRHPYTRQLLESVPVADPGRYSRLSGTTGRGAERAWAPR